MRLATFRLLDLRYRYAHRRRALRGRPAAVACHIIIRRTRPLAPAKPLHEATWSGSAVDLPHLLVIDLRRQHLERSLDDGAPTGNLIRCRRIAHRMSDRHAAKDSIGSCLQGDRRERGNERGRDTLPFHFPGQRCPAPCSGPSRAREHDGVNARLAQFVRYLTSHSHGHRHRGVIARRHVEVIMQLSDATLLLEVTKSVEGH